MSEQRTYKAFIFDLDGTLLHTLPDLVNVTNKALADQGFPPHTPEEILTYVGDGAARLIAQAVPADATPEQAERVFQNFKNFYHDFGIIYTTEFEGITAALEQAKEAGVGLAILVEQVRTGCARCARSLLSRLDRSRPWRIRRGSAQARPYRAVALCQ